MSKKKKKRKAETVFGQVANPDFIVYTDGGCAVNPGGPGGIGIVMIDAETGELQEFSAGYVSTTNNRMEVRAILTALDALPDGATARLYSDSEYALNCLSGAWGRNTNNDLWRQIDRAAAGHKLELRWIRGHNGEQHNERCDELASKAMFSGELIVDDGYTGRKASGSGKRPLSLPEGVEDSPPPSISVAEYQERFGVKESCARAILQFYKKGNKSFSAYLDLKTGGIDSWSRKKIDVLTEQITNADALIPAIAEAVGEDSVLAVLRWHARGLTFSDSVRKVQVDREVAHNCMG